MSKIEKWWYQFSFYTKLKTTLAGVLIIVEAELLRNDAHWMWHSASVVIGIVLLILTNWVEDKNNNGKVDFFENRQRQMTRKDEPKEFPKGKND
jgi:hypothetical protein